MSGVVCLLCFIIFDAATHAANIAPLGRAVASSEYAPGATARVNNGVYTYPEGSWISSEKEKEPQWVYIIWDQEHSISGVKLFFLEAGKEKDPEWGENFVPPAFSVQMLSKNSDPTKDESWQTVESVEQNTDSPYARKFDKPLVTKGIRVYVTEATPQSMTSDTIRDHMVAIKEIEVWEGEMPVATKSIALDRNISFEQTPESMGKYYQVKRPLFQELLSNKPGPRHVLYYGYNDLLVDEEYRPYAKKFGRRYVFAEERQELLSRPFVPMTNAWARGGVGVYPTMRMILRHDAQGVAPKVFGDNPWIMHPGWQEAYVKAAVKLLFNFMLTNEDEVNKVNNR